MDTAAIRRQLHGYLEVAEDKKINAIYTMVEEEIKETLVDYSPEFITELNERVDHYLKGNKTISSEEMNNRLQSLRKKRK